MNDFSDVEKVQNEIKKYLDMSNYKYSSDRPDDDVFLIYHTLQFERQELRIFVGLTSENPHKIDIVSIVRFSPEHVEVMRENPENIVAKMSDAVFMWMTPREPQYMLKLDQENNFENSSYIIITPIYSGDLTFGNFMKSIDLTISGSLLTRKLIQSNLNKYITIEEVQK